MPYFLASKPKAAALEQDMLDLEAHRSVPQRADAVALRLARELPTFEEAARLVLDRSRRLVEIFESSRSGYEREKQKVRLVGLGIVMGCCDDESSHDRFSRIINSLGL